MLPIYLSPFLKAIFQSINKLYKKNRGGILFPDTAIPENPQSCHVSSTFSASFLKTSRFKSSFVLRSAASALSAIFLSSQASEVRFQVSPPLFPLHLNRFAFRNPFSIRDRSFFIFCSISTHVSRIQICLRFLDFFSVFRTLILTL